MAWIERLLQLYKPKNGRTATEAQFPCPLCLCPLVPEINATQNLHFRLPG
jgi:hypothetical protein